VKSLSQSAQWNQNENPASNECFIFSGAGKDELKIWTFSSTLQEVQFQYRYLSLLLNPSLYQAKSSESLCLIPPSINCRILSLTSLPIRSARPTDQFLCRSNFHCVVACLADARIQLYLFEEEMKTLYLCHSFKLKSSILSSSVLFFDCMFSCYCVYFNLIL
jgi:hypothetical protein